MPIESVAILGTGLIGASVGLALRANGFEGSIAGWDPNRAELHTALRREAITVIADDPLTAAAEADLILLAGPVFTILEWLDRLAPILRSHQLVTDVGSVKAAICNHASGKYNGLASDGSPQPGFLPGHPMAGKELGGAENADANLFANSAWLFTTLSSRPEGAKAPAAEGPAFNLTTLSSRPEGAPAPVAEGPAFNLTTLSSRPEGAKAPAAEGPALSSTTLSSRPEGAKAPAAEGPAFNLTTLSSRPESAPAPATEGPAFNSTTLSSRPEGAKAPAAEGPAFNPTTLSSRPEGAKAPVAEGPAFNSTTLSSRPEGAKAPAAEGPAFNPPTHPLAHEWRAWVAKFGARIIDIPPDRHDTLCAWISHLPQFVSTALSALLEDEFAANADLLPIGGRALREMTRLGSSPFSMWRDIAHTNTDAIAHSLLALEQHLAHIRENLKTPELRDEFDRANRFRLRQTKTP